MKIFTFPGILILWLLAWLPAQLRAQNYLLPVNGNANYTTCSGTLYDSGGPTGDYVAGYSEATVTLTPATPGSKLQLTFTMVDVDPQRAIVSVYDGAATTYPLLIESFTSGTHTVHATNTEGKLTVRFYSGNAPTKPGFAATISCATNVVLPDLAVRGIKVTPTRVMPTQNCTATMQITNLSGVPTNSYTSFFLSADTLYSTNDRYISSNVGERLEVGQSITYPMWVEVPAGTAPGRYYVLGVADPYRAVSESNEANNVGYVAVDVLPPAPDLQPQEFGTSVVIASLAPGQGAVLGCPISNRGVRASGPTMVGYYLSTDNTLSADDEFIDEAPLGALEPGASASPGVGVSIPLGKPYRRYYLFFVADYLHQLAESDEDNNVSYAALDVVPPTIDLLMLYSAIVTPDELGAGGQVSTICCVQNWGNVMANPCTVGYYLSTDRTFSSDDVLVGDTLVAGYSGTGVLLGGEYSYVYGRATIPLTTPPGRYYLLQVADHRNQLTETNESNNVIVTDLNVVIPDVDLVIDMPKVNSPSEASGNPLGVSCYLTNRGSTAASPCTVGYYLSRDKELSADDKLIGNASIPVLSKQNGNFLGGSPIIPAGTAPGSYYVLLVADYLHQVAETNENNNVAYVAIEVVKPTYDLAFESSPTVGPNPAPAGSTLNASCHLRNLGPTTAYYPSVGYYLSTDQVLDAQDVLIGSVSTYILSGNYYAYLTGKPVLPLATKPGTYYVLFVADHLKQLAETNEDNNVAYATVQVTAVYPDLAIPAPPVVSPAQVLAGGSISAICTLQNNGTGLAAPATVGYYLSTDQVLDAKDVLIGQATWPAVYPGANMYLPGSATIPATTPSGAYYVLFVADHLKQLPETNEDNNSNYLALRVLVTGVDLTVPTATLGTTAVIAGNSTTASATVFNGGSVAAGSSPLGFYLSTDPGFDAADVLLTTVPGDALASATGATRSATLTIPSGTPTGSYYLLAVADPLGVVPEANERNNVAALTLSVVASFAGTVVPASGSSTLTACAGKVYDNGGPGNYPNNADGTLTILPATAGALVQLTFSAFDTEKRFDYLEVYDGPSTSAPLLGTFEGPAAPGTLRASNTSATGALTLRFVSNGGTTAAGFEASISCAQRLAAREQLAGYELRVLPVPVASPAPLQVQLSGLGQHTTATLALYNTLGQAVATQSLALAPGRLNQAELPTAGLPPGVYVLRLSGDGLLAVRRVVVE